ncbi:kinase-like domain-containing protein [Suillus paluster]|uniref:kinase-like domain-containing protein n=1 Tax=Suillus paluster TaxID=48578 RepID=UPI001B875758|nr:kinase-like domain-containing protein [Suillus paluster]KAG1727192.1 kinase-like domain-containing protein [Suillus paluster]
MSKVPVQVDGRFRLGDVLGSGSYAVMYCARNIINNDVVAIKLEPIVNNLSSLQREYHILKQLEGGVGIPHVLWFGRESTYHALALNLLGSSLHDIFLIHSQKFSLHTVVNLGDQLLSCLEYIHSHNYVHGDIKPQNVMVGLNDLRHTVFIIDFGIVKDTPAFASINNHLGVEPGRRDNLESLTYMLIYFLCGSLPWLSDCHEKLSSAAILEHKVNTTVEVLCHGIPVEFASILVYSRSLAFSEDPDYDYLCSLLHGLRATLPASATCLLDFSKPDDLSTHTPAIPDEYRVTEVTPPYPLKATPLRLINSYFTST